MSYNIKKELLLVQKLNDLCKNEYVFFNKDSQNKYDVDIETNIWIKDKDSQSGFKQFKNLIKIEAEDTPTWNKNLLPDYYTEVSFLKRKLYQYDFTKNYWTNQIKKDCYKTIYVKHNNSFSNCFFMPMWEIIQNGKESKRSDGTRKNSYISFNKNEIFNNNYFSYSGYRNLKFCICLEIALSLAEKCTEIVDNKNDIILYNENFKYLENWTKQCFPKCKDYKTFMQYLFVLKGLKSNPA
tara:strand:+ start:1444 stop:2160 length:717 start_codon:yes stop_codon:yes gene_type:complete